LKHVRVDVTVTKRVLIHAPCSPIIDASKMARVQEEDSLRCEIVRDEDGSLWSKVSNPTRSTVGRLKVQVMTLNHEARPAWTTISGQAFGEVLSGITQTRMDSGNLGPIP
jgi:hypothetical protein